MPFKKNTAVTGFPFALISASDGSAITTGTVTGYYLLDGGTQGSISGTPVHEGNGQWSVALTAGEMNGDVVGLLFTHASAVNVHFTIKTETKLVSELNDVSAAEVNTQCDTALTDYDAPTHAELQSEINDVQTDIAALNDPTAVEIRTEMDTNSTQLAAIVADTDELQTDDVPGLIAALNDVSTAEVNAQVVDVLKTDTISEMTQQAPPATPTFEQAVMYVYMALRNKIDVTTSVKEFHNDAGTCIWKKALSDDATTYTEAEGATGP